VRAAGGDGQLGLVVCVPKEGSGVETLCRRGGCGLAVPAELGSALCCKETQEPMIHAAGTAGGQCCTSSCRLS
jgi:hypothetical protein